MMHYRPDQGRFSRYQWLAVYLMLLSIVVVGGWFITHYLDNRARQDILKENGATILVLTTHLNGELKKIEGAVKALASADPISVAIVSRKDQDIVAANAVLDRYTSALDVSVSYLMNASGITIASSNRNDSDGFVGKSYNFRPYFMQAMGGNSGRYFALGVTSLKRGFYASYPVRDRKGSIIGVVAMKKDLDGMEQQLSRYPYCFFVNPQGIIFLSGKPEMLLKSLWPVHGDVNRELSDSKQFGDKPLEAVLSQEVADGMEVNFRGDNYLASRKFIDPEGWSIVLMTPTDRIMIYKSVGVILTLIVCLLIAIPFAFTYQTVRSAEIVRRSEERFQQVAQSSQDWIWETDIEGRFTYSSQALKNILGYEPKEVIGKRYSDFCVPEEKKEITRTFKGFFDRKESFFRVVNRTVHRNGRQIFLESTGIPLLGADGGVDGYRGTNRDISDRKQAEDALCESEKRYRSVIENIHDVYYCTDERGIITMISPSVLRMLGYDTLDEILGKPIEIFWMHPEERVNMVRRINKEGPVRDYEVTLKKKDGSPLFVAVTSAFRMNDEGKTLGVEGIIRDISERKRVEEALRESEERYRAFFKTSRDCVFITSADGTLIDMNEAAVELFGYSSRKEMMQVKIPDLYADPERRAKHISVIAEYGYTKEFPVDLRKEDGAIIHTLTTSVARKDTAGNIIGYQGTIRDVTAHKRAEKEREMLIHDLQEALSQIKTLSGLLPICASCKKIRDDQGYWTQIEVYIRDRSEAEFSHSVCPECAQKLYPQFFPKQMM